MTEAFVSVMGRTRKWYSPPRLGLILAKLWRGACGAKTVVRPKRFFVDVSGA
ncbi:hypothetical protein [Ruegeria arenilitoris]|uniref:hypothetical protein n=1 Tax=Ruegeria arenilitoris TaxID=1173585 RepID=UPI00147FD52B|nr:hypothetical protein [Ruegeria arenilitoris]